MTVRELRDFLDLFPGDMVVMNGNIVIIDRETGEIVGRIEAGNMVCYLEDGMPF